LFCCFVSFFSCSCCCCGRSTYQRCDKNSFKQIFYLLNGRSFDWVSNWPLSPGGMNQKRLPSKSFTFSLSIIILL
jgi:hypothetical protein